jgi:predicted alpha/beta hydrolase family esterase
MQKISAPKQRSLSEKELSFLKTAQQTSIPFMKGSIQVYQWGKGQQIIGMIHGWEGRTSNFSTIVKLLQDDFTIIAFDAPSHGLSSTQSTTFFDFIEAVQTVMSQYSINHIISHSFGSVAVLNMLANHPQKIEKIAMFTSPNRFKDRMLFSAEQAGMHPKTIKKFMKTVEKRFKIKIDELNVSDIVSKISIKDKLILHDINDKVVSIDQSKQIQSAWSNVELQEFKGTGHYRILHDTAALEKLKTFLLS